MRRKHLLTCLIVLNLCLIWGNSLMTAADSSNVSGGIVAWLAQYLPFFGTEFGHTLLRKLAHFAEFAMLGVLTGLRNGEKISHLGLGLAVACIDETIQIYTPGRASSLLDVWIDAAGFAVGLGVVLVGNKFLNQISNGGQTQ